MATKPKPAHKWRPGEHPAWEGIREAAKRGKRAPSKSPNARKR